MSERSGRKPSIFKRTGETPVAHARFYPLGGWAGVFVLVVAGWHRRLLRSDRCVQRRRARRIVGGRSTRGFRTTLPGPLVAGATPTIFRAETYRAAEPTAEKSAVLPVLDCRGAVLCVLSRSTML